MAEYVLDASELKERAKDLHAGDRVILSGVVYTSRDAAHKRIVKLIEEGGELPFDLDGACVYLCAVGGAGALAAKCVKECKEIAFFDLGCESVKRIVLDKFPLIVGIDCHSGSLFKKQE